jgi:hypothetical protein
VLPYSYEPVPVIVPAPLGLAEAEIVHLNFSKLAVKFLSFVIVNEYY